ncbi:sulfotransferase [cf. Phormidesmis sp. LEGE 11477]|uniref:sulfotransferase family protein n=1 Tax=cf. Phormidesmis sp. LEGE 11477 TaxID=1828680 RepID=UPI00187ED47C|nr:sulfotransferase [cf. Phormidesmis sp. LEGE 11477]MBE9062318.1 sulfotransferase [cf. Phormidesmis sp. LEGE 11477]
MQMPNFLIIGAAKAGTTSLYSYLAQHPQIYMSEQKEPRFFALEGEQPSYGGITQGINRGSISTLADYQKLFEGVSDEVAVGEASTIYLYSEKASDRIQHHIPDAKLIAVLRNPADRAFSSYVHLVRDGFETLSFAEGLRAEPNRREENWQPLWFYQHRGFYYGQLKRYFDRFDSQQIKVYLYEDLVRSAQTVAQDIYQFLGVDDGFVPDLTRSNVSGIPKRRWLQNLFMKDNPLKSVVKPLLPKQMRKRISRDVHRQNTGDKPAFPPEVRQQLIETYREDILKLQDLLNRDLSGWLK